ncbi:UNVERIFIED_CONTAM: hypothetical protein FKN15_060214 [Acipenser sinensis]
MIVKAKTNKKFSLETLSCVLLDTTTLVSVWDVVGVQEGTRGVGLLSAGGVEFARGGTGGSGCPNTMLPCLLILTPEQQADYLPLSEALRSRFGSSHEPGRAFVHMPSDVQEELALDQFVEAIGTAELWAQVHLLWPQSLQDAVELAHEREMVWATERQSSAGRS